MACKVYTISQALNKDKRHLWVGGFRGPGNSARADGEAKTVRGRIYLFRGNRKDCLERFKGDFR